MKKKIEKIIWTKTDEAPMLASYSFLPILQSFTKDTGISIEVKDISLAGRILSSFPERIKEIKKVPDELKELAELAQKPEANIIKLPNISASVPQLKSAISELKSQGFDIPDYNDDPQTEKETNYYLRYAKILGSAVNPVLREGNSDRRVADAVKNYIKLHPYKMSKWESNSKSHISTMKKGDFFSNEKSTTFENSTTAKIEFISKKNKTILLKGKLHFEAGEVVDSTFLSKKELDDFIVMQIQDAKKKGVLFSLHLKATMMKVSDPIIFGEFVRIFYDPVLKKHADTFADLKLNLNNGIGELYEKIENNKRINPEKKAEIESDIKTLYDQRPDLAMVDSDLGITNLHVPNNIIIDASLPAAIRASGKMYGKDGNLHDTKFIIPDSSYAPLYAATIENCIAHGSLDPTKIGTVQNVGLMAKKAEEYGSHSTTFVAPGNGKIRITDENDWIIHEHFVDKGDIWRMSSVKDSAIRDWIKLAVRRSKITGWPAVFWLDEKRAHGRELIKKVNTYLKDEETEGLELPILSVYDAAKLTIEKIRDGQNIISVTGNVLRDYNTDLYPIIELGTSSKMLSIVPLIKGGGLFETGAGGSAPKHIQQFLKEGHLRWDSIGEFLALAESFDHLGRYTDNSKAKVFSKTLNQAIEKFLNYNKSPSRIVNELDNRGSHFYLALYWAEALSLQEDDKELNRRFFELAKVLGEKETKILNELNEAQGNSVDLGGYFNPDEKKVSEAMRPSPTFNNLLFTFSDGEF